MDDYAELIKNLKAGAVFGPDESLRLLAVEAIGDLVAGRDLAMKEFKLTEDVYIATVERAEAAEALIKEMIILWENAAMMTPGSKEWVKKARAALEQENETGQ